MSGEVIHLTGTVGESIEWLQDRDDTKAVVVLVQDSEGSWSGTWSRMSIKELVFAERVLRFYIDRDLGRCWEPT